MKTTSRTDIHREGAFVPADYSHVMSFEAPTEGIGYRWNCETDEAIRGEHGVIVRLGSHRGEGCCLSVLRRQISTGKIVAPFNLALKCAVCGASFKAGDVWQHSNGEYITLGHTCVDKYSMLCDRAQYAAWKIENRKMRSIAIKTKARINRAANFLATVPGLAEALSFDHRISRDLAGKVEQYGSISPAQIALAFKIVKETTERKAAQDEEIKVPAPLGRVKFTGTIVGQKYVSGFAYNSPDVCKIIVKVSAEGGVWLAYMTAPSGLDTFDKGSVVEITATLEAGRDAHFAFGKRPVGRTVESAKTSEAAIDNSSQTEVSL